MSTTIVIQEVWEYRHPISKHQHFHNIGTFKDNNRGYKRVRKTPVYAVIEETDNSFLAPVQKLIAVYKRKHLAEAAARLLQ